MELVRFGWITYTVMELRADSLTVLLIHLEVTTVRILKMLESDVSQQLVCMYNISFESSMTCSDYYYYTTMQYVIKEISESEEVLMAHTGVLKCAMITSGELFVMISLTIVKPW